MELAEKVNLALKCRNNGDFKQAEEIYLDILADNPDNSIILSFLGVMHYELSELEKAKKYLQQAYDIKPNNVIIKMLALTYYSLGEVVNAEKYLSECAKFDKSPEIYNKLITIITLWNTGYNKAYKYSIDLYKRFPFDIENLTKLSEICLYTGRFNDCINFCNKALKLDNKYGKAWLQKGLIEEVLNYDDETARKYYKKAIKLGCKKEAYYNLCISYSHGEYKKSNYYGKTLLKMGQVNNSNEIVLTIGTNYFKMKKMKQGYEHYIHYWDRHPHSDMERFWRGETNKDETLFIFCDMGYGDKFMFIRYLPIAAKKFRHVKVMCDINVRALLKYSYSHLKNVTFYKMSQNFPQYDKFIPALCLPYALNLGFDKIPYSSGYLSVPPEKVEDFKKKYFNTDKLKVGICWETGACTLRTLHNRSMILSDFKKLFDIKDIQLYSLQVDAVSADKNIFDSKKLIDLEKAINHYDDTAAALKNLDILVTVDTSVAHLAGALGIKTFLLLPFYAEWRWFDNTETTEWYDSVKIFKQTRKKSWDNEIGAICMNIRSMLD